MSNPFVSPPTTINWPTSAIKTWVYQVWVAIQNFSGSDGNTTITGNLTVTGNATIDGNVTVDGVVTDAQTYTRNLGIYHGLLGE